MFHKYVYLSVLYIVVLLDIQRQEFVYYNALLQVFMLMLRQDCAFQLRDAQAVHMALTLNEFVYKCVQQTEIILLTLIIKHVLDYVQLITMRTQAQERVFKLALKFHHCMVNYQIKDV